LRYLGAYRAWQEAVLSDPNLAKKQQEIHSWTTGRVLRVFHSLQQLPGARQKVDTEGLARAMDSFFWTLLSQAAQLTKTELNQSIDAATHLIYHALFTDRSQAPVRKRTRRRSAQITRELSSGQAVCILVAPSAFFRVRPGK
jgi:hypothetical protein